MVVCDAAASWRVVVADGAGVMKGVVSHAEKRISLV